MLLSIFHQQAQSCLHEGVHARSEHLSEQASFPRPRSTRRSLVRRGFYAENGK